jgi:5-deoxy-5-amino-3-dehydroquinate dehydratase
VPELLLLNGPNLGELGRRQVHIYGTTPLQVIESEVEAMFAGSGYRTLAYQSDSEAALIGILRRHASARGALINPGALMIAGWSLRDALESFPAPFIEVHLSNVWRRESFRHESVISPLAAGVIAGLGPLGYRAAAFALLELVRVAERRTTDDVKTWNGGAAVAAELGGNR